MAPGATARAAQVITVKPKQLGDINNGERMLQLSRPWGGAYNSLVVNMLIMPLAAKARRQVPLAVAIVLACAAVPAHADPVELHLESQPLSTALRELARVAGIQIAIQSGLTEHKRAPRLSGKFEPAAALIELLRGSGLVAYPVNATTYGVREVNSTLNIGDTRQTSWRLAEHPLVRSDIAESSDTSQSDTPTPQSTGEASLPAPSRDNGAKSNALEEVVVTATRRAESIQDVPISITAFSQEQMDVQGVKQIDDIARLSPSIQFTRGGGGFGSDLSNSISIRGMGASATGFTSGPATTGIYVDDTPVEVGATIASGSFTDNAYPMLFDIARVEVLNGPQGTLFGSGAEGGAVRFITPAPNMTTPSVYARTEASYTEYGAPSYEAGIAGGAPIISDTLGFRASIWTRHTGGYVDQLNYYTGAVTSPNFNYQDAFSSRVAFGWVPVDGLTITPSFYFQHARANGDSSFALRGDGLTGVYTPPFGGPSETLPVFQQPYGNVANGDYVDMHLVTQYQDQRMALPALKVEWALPHDLELFSNTSYYDRTERGVADYGGLEVGQWAGQVYPPNPTWLNPGSQDQGNRFITQEVRVQTTDPNARIKWQAGIFASKATTTDTSDVYDPYLGQLINDGPFGPCGAPATCLSEVFGNTGLQQGIYSFENTTSLVERQKAVFGQADVRLLGGLTATLGLRYTKFNTNWINEEGGPVTGVNWPGANGEPETGTAAAHALTPKVMLQYKTDGGLTYVSATKGFRNGGVNAPLNNSQCQGDLLKLGLNAAPPSYNPDSVWSYELGSKWTLDQGRLALSGAVFQYNWTNLINLQTLSTCGLSFTTNQGSAQGRGFEVAAMYRPVDPLTVSMNIGYHYLKNTSTTYATSGAIQVENGDLVSGGGTVNVSAHYTFDVLEHRSYLQVDYNYQGRPSFENNPNDAEYISDPHLIFLQPGYGQTNGRLGAAFGNWDVSVFCNNLFNAQPILNAQRSTVTTSAVDTSLVYASTLRPRTSGVTATYRF